MSQVNASNFACTRNLDLSRCIVVDGNCDSEHHHQWNHAVNSRYSHNMTCISEEVVRGHGPSGPGSSLKATKPLRDMLEAMFQDPSWSIKTFADIPCGDWLWMQEVNLSGIRYLGGDISEETVKRNTECFSRKGVQFVYFDLTCMVPPPVDLILVRDVLFHLKHDVTLGILTRLARSGARYIATSTFPGTGKPNQRWGVGKAYHETLKDRSNSQIGSFPIRLTDPPFNLPEPLMYVEENEFLSKPKIRRRVGVWELHGLRKYLSSSVSQTEEYGK